MARRRRFGFTLVELLVVIGIIAILVAMLLPSLNKARKAAKTAACLSNARQLAMGAIMYWEASRGYSPYYNGGGTPWDATIGENQFQIEWPQQFVKTTQWNKVRLCPEASEPNPILLGQVTPNPPVPPNPGNVNMAGGAFYAWGPYGRAFRYFDQEHGNVTLQLSGSYSGNGFLLKGVGGKPSDLFKEGGGGTSAAQLELGKSRLHQYPCKNASSVPVICDGLWANSWIREEENIVGTPSLYYPIGPTNNFGNDWRRIVMARHGFAINVGFCDGHAETVPLPDLWKLRWSRNWDLNKLPAGQSLETIRAYLQSMYKQGI